MFTGIITETGVVTTRTRSRISLRTSQRFIRKLTRGASVAVDGACLTVVGKKARVFSADIMPETVGRTTLGHLSRGVCVNLELPASPTSFLSGHVVEGHIDGIGTLTKIAQKGNSRMLTFSIPRTLSKYVVEKGSITVNGVALTVIESGKNHFTVGIIPHTRKATNLSALKRGDKINIEVDVLAKYVEKFV